MQTEINYMIAPAIKDFIFLGGVFGSLIFNYAMLIANSKSNAEKLTKLGKDVNATNDKIRTMETKATHYLTFNQGNDLYVQASLFNMYQDNIEKQLKEIKTAIATLSEIKEGINRLDSKISNQAELAKKIEAMKVK